MQRMAELPAPQGVPGTAPRGDDFGKVTETRHRAVQRVRRRSAVEQVAQPSRGVGEATGRPLTRGR
jgi:hypothetical protein